MSHVSHRLKNSVEGALAGGGDPATSPLYVFGPFLKLIVLGGVANVTFGASVWLVVLTVVCVSAMYRLVMTWITDGTGGSGLCEEEFGAWAVKVNAAITFIEYTLTFLVSIAALVTFVADRVPAVSGGFLGFPYRTALAVVLSFATAAIVNRGPRVAARAFGPATGAVLLLLWVMVAATIWRRGLSLPNFDLRAFTPGYLHFTLGGYARILALMTGVEVFANLVSAYDGNARNRSKLAFRSLLIIMGTTSVTMLVVGPAMFAMADPRNETVSVFTQTMDQLLPAPLPYVGTLIGIAVLLSAAAASAQGLQNLSLGLRYRHYVPARFGERNAFDVADKPVWLQAALVCLCFVVFGTHEETYLALYAAGVFVLLSLTGWAAVKRLLRQMRASFRPVQLVTLFGTFLASVLGSTATYIIFRERFTEGAWVYFVLVPVLYGGFSYFRARLGSPHPVEDRLGRVVSDARHLAPIEGSLPGGQLRRIVMLLDGTMRAELALACAARLGRAANAALDLLVVVTPTSQLRAEQAQEYLDTVADDLHETTDLGVVVHQCDELASGVEAASRARAADLVVLSTRKWSDEGLGRKLAKTIGVPLLVLNPMDQWKSRRSRFGRILVALDGSEMAEDILAMAVAIGRMFQSEIILLSVPEGSESESFATTIGAYLERWAGAIRSQGLAVRTMSSGSGPARTIVATSESEDVDLVVIGRHGRGGVERIDHIKLGSVADRVVKETVCPTLLVPVGLRGKPGK